MYQMFHTFIIALLHIEYVVFSLNKLTPLINLPIKHLMEEGFCMFNEKSLALF